MAVAGYLVLVAFEAWLTDGHIRPMAWGIIPMAIIFGLFWLDFIRAKNPKG